MTDLSKYPEWVRDNAMSYLIAFHVRKFLFVSIEKCVYIPNDDLRTRAFIDRTLKIGALRISWCRPLESISELK